MGPGLFGNRFEFDGGGGINEGCTGGGGLSEICSGLDCILFPKSIIGGGGGGAIINPFLLNWRGNPSPPSGGIGGGMNEGTIVIPYTK